MTGQLPNGRIKKILLYGSIAAALIAVTSLVGLVLPWVHAIDKQIDLIIWISEVKAADEDLARDTRAWNEHLDTIPARDLRQKLTEDNVAAIGGNVTQLNTQFNERMSRVEGMMELLLRERGIPVPPKRAKESP